MQKIFAFFICIAILASLVCTVSAAPAETLDITESTTFSCSGYEDLGFLVDRNTAIYQVSEGNAAITLTNEQGMASLYLLFDLEYGEYTITDNAGNTFTAGKYEILHEYVDLLAAFGSAPTSVTLSFEKGSVSLSEIYVFSGTDVPDFVQKWNTPLESGADILLFSTHGDDEQLFFAGLLPLYAAEKGCRVQIVYMTDHREHTNVRTHEMLNGLWSVGVRAYPVFGRFGDFLVKDMEETYEIYQNSYNTSREDLQSFVVEQLRRFKPMVAIGHDINGEYQHGMHMVYTDLLIKAIDLIGDPDAFADSAAKYGTWELPKLYLHLYKKRAITIDYDQPLASFDGMTAFEVTQKIGFPCHKSQQWTWFHRWLYGEEEDITKASQIEEYNPGKFGLYHSSVGKDVEKNDFLENIVLYEEQERLEQDRLEPEEQENELLQQPEEKHNQQLATTVITLAVLVILPAIVVVYWIKEKKLKK